MRAPNGGKRVKCVCGRGSAPDQAEETYSAPPHSLTGFREEAEGKKWEMQESKKNRKGKGRERRGGRWFGATWRKVTFWRSGGDGQMDVPVYTVSGVEGQKK